MRIEDFIKHDPHCLAGKYSTIGRCSCGAQAALEELAVLREAARQWTADKSDEKLSTAELIRVLNKVRGN